MQHIITDEEAERYAKMFNLHQGSLKEYIKAALLDFLTNRPELTLGKLRPIAEMPETVPDGCVRVSVGKNALGDWIACDGEHAGLNFAIDIQLPTPDPEAEERQRFEEAMKGKDRVQRFERNQDGSYVSHLTQACWTAWKLAKAK